MELEVIKKIAALGKAGYEPEDRESHRIFTMVRHGPSQDSRAAAHNRQGDPNVVLLRDDGETFVPEWSRKELEDDLHAVAASLHIDTSGRELHDLIPFIVEKIGFMHERMVKLESVVQEQDIDIEEAGLD